jgi:hypothetical protein
MTSVPVSEQLPFQNQRTPAGYPTPQTTVAPCCGTTPAKTLVAPPGNMIVHLGGQDFIVPTALWQLAQDPSKGAASLEARQEIATMTGGVAFSSMHSGTQASSASEIVKQTQGIIAPTVVAKAAQQEAAAQAQAVAAQPEVVVKAPFISKSVPASQQVTPTWGTGEQYRGILSDTQIAVINSGLKQSRSMAEDFFSAYNPGLPRGVYFTGEVSKVKSSELPPPTFKESELMTSGYAKAVMGASEDVRNWFTGAIGTVEKAIPETKSGEPIRQQTHMVGGVLEFIPESVLALALLPAVGEAIVRQPGTMAESLIPGVGAQIAGLKQQASEDPMRLIGNVAAMAIAPKLIRVGSEAAAKYVPEIPKIGIGESVFGESKIYSAAIGERVLGGFARTSEGLKPFVGVPREIALGKQAWELPTGFGEQFNPKGAVRTMSPAEKSIFLPLLKETQQYQGLYELATARTTLAKESASLPYQQATPIGSIPQEALTPESLSNIYKTMSTGRAEIAQPGSRMLAEIVGEKYLTSVRQSDIDLDISLKALGSTGKQMYNDIIAGQRGTVSSRGNPIVYEPTAIKFHIKEEQGKVPSIRIIGAQEPGAGLMTREWQSVSGPIRGSTPEYEYLSKMSRSYEMWKYDPITGKIGIVFSERKPIDVPRSAVAMEYIAKTAYESGKPELALKYETMANAVRMSAESQGLKAYTEFKSLPRVLENVKKAPVPTTWYNKMLKGMGETASMEAYPKSLRTTGGYPTEIAIGAGMFGGIYPPGIRGETAKYPTTMQGKNHGIEYPTAVTKAIELYPVTERGHPSDVGSAISDMVYPQAARAQYQAPTVTPDVYPVGQNIVHPHIGVTPEVYPGTTPTVYPRTSTGPETGPALGAFVSGLLPHVATREKLVLPEKPKEEYPYYRKRKIPSMYVFQEISPTFTPNEIIGNLDIEKPFYRVTGHKGLVEKRTPPSPEFFKRAEPDFTNVASAQVAGATGIEFYRTATKKEGAPRIMERKSTPFDVVEMVGGFRKKGKATGNNRVNKFVRGLF